MKIKSILLSSVAATGLFAIGTTIANADTVTVKAGDTVSAIAETHKTTVAAIQKANKLKNVNLIFVGDKLEVNGTTAKTTTVTATLPSSAASQSNAASASSTSTTSVASQSSATSASSTSTTSAASQSSVQSAASTSTTSAASQSSATSASSTSSSAASQASQSSASVSAASSSTPSSAASQSSTSTATSASTTNLSYSTNASSSNATSATTTTSTTTSTSSSSEASAKAWIANKESGGSYTASNGNYYGKYQLTKSLLNGDLSAANQESVANAYVTSRYGSWTAAKTFWEANGYY
ncbi:LysM peptidoglycan-binding domain-containing protein [Lactiplantibacillus sp. WILCCON 0030]|uniref:LysM peptidoglycan-binding domain-containing protein n=1 Tax=Lactiplantibacillus brownii TaxID=3069269 RepID=A0ABU1AAZ1_9LACO|nr:LysM peptidoglycan-binding domain-containing protein [Lactiplantibacillus brownii]MDQ7938153.1 LysM peptidoglycan-binding domain-containing protein [Lactiplantibacillus brownii]